MWEERKDLAGKVTGVLVEGDSKVPVTTRWNHWFLCRFVWKWLRFYVPAGKRYQVGFIPLGSTTPIVKKRFFSDHTFQTRIGHEACRFFAIDRRGHEIPLSTDNRRSKKKWFRIRAH